jgi:large subunit ribosomal protein LP1
MSTPAETKANPELAVSYAALILADSSVTITPDKLQTLLKAAGVDDVEPIWTTLFAKALEGKDVKEIVTAVAASGPAVDESDAPIGINDPNPEKGEDGDEGEKIGESDDEDFGMDLFG